MNKTLIGKDNFLFLFNEIDCHCTNDLKINDVNLSQYINHNYKLFVYPDKCIMYKNKLPDNVLVDYRPSVNFYKNKLKNKFHDLYNILKKEDDVYYKTDTHINNKGNYLVYNYFIKVINSNLNLNIIPEEIKFNIIKENLSGLGYGIGDLTWPSNLGDQVLTDTLDNYYFNERCIWYNKYKIKNTNIRFLDYTLIDNTQLLEGSICEWTIISKYIINIKNTNKVNLKILIFYDSFLLGVLPLYFYLFNEIFFIKNIYSNELIQLIQPDYIFEFRVERFLY